MPTTATNTWSQKKLEPQLGSTPLTTPVRIAPSLTLALGTVLGKITATGKFKAYDDAAVDGSAVAVGILPYRVVTDASGNITNMGDQNSVQTNVDIYHNGIFRVGDLVALDAAAVVDLHGRYVGGDSSATGFLAIP